MSARRNRVEKYISFQEIPPLLKTRRWYVVGKDGKPFGLVRWYGGWRRYVCYVEAEGLFMEAACLRLIADFLDRRNAAHKNGEDA